MISYIEKGQGLHDEIAKQGHWLRQRDNVWISSDDVAVQAIIDNYDPTATAKAASIAAVDIAAGEARSRYLTIAPGQELTYEQKRRNSYDFRAAGYPSDIEDYPMVKAESEATGSTPAEAADSILATAAAWTTMAAYIEKVRRKASVDIKAASAAADIESIAADAVWNLDQV